MRSKILTLLLSILYFLSNGVFLYAAETRFWAERKMALADAQLASLPVPSPLNSGGRPTNFDAPSNIPKFKTGDSIFKSIPQSAAKIKSIRPAPGFGEPVRRATVYLLQDVHLQTEAQRNLAKAIESMNSSSSRRLLIGVEGAFGPFDFSPFRRFDDDAIRSRVADRLLNGKKIAAPSYAGLTFKDPLPRFVGIEDPASYRANLEAYLDAQRRQERDLARLNGRKRDLAERKKTILNDHLKELDAILEGYQSESLSLGDTITRLIRLDEKTALSSNLPTARDLVLDQFLSAIEIEKELDFKKVERERADVLHRLATITDPSAFNPLLKAGAAYRSGRLSYAGFYRTLSDTMEKAGVPLRMWPEFNRYVQYVLLSDGINPDALFDAIAALEDALLARLARAPEEKRLMRESRRLVLLKKLLTFSLIPKEWEELKSSSRPGPRSLSEGERGETHRGNYQSYYDFYRHADRRSHLLVDHLIHEWKKDAGRSVPVLIAGGFHTPLAEELFRKKGFSTVLIQPRITEAEENGSRYLSIFTQEKADLDQLFSGQKLFLAPYQTALGTTFPGARPVNELARRLLKEEYRKEGKPIPPGAEPSTGEKIALVLFETLLLKTFLSLLGADPFSLLISSVFFSLLHPDLYRRDTEGKPLLFAWRALGGAGLLSLLLTPGGIPLSFAVHASANRLIEWGRKNKWPAVSMLAPLAIARPDEDEPTVTDRLIHIGPVDLHAHLQADGTLELIQADLIHRWSFSNIRLPKSITIGRDPDNTVVLPDLAVSRHHATLTVERKNDVVSVWIEDPESKNGTRLDEDVKSISGKRLLLRGKTDSIAEGRHEIGKLKAGHGHVIDQGKSTGRQGADTREILVVDFDKDPALLSFYEEIKRAFLERSDKFQRKGEIKGELIKMVFETIKERVDADKAAAKKLADRYKGKEVYLGEAALLSGRGVCRHYGLIAAAVIERLIVKDRILKGRIYYARGPGHGWAVYQTSGGEFFVLDIALDRFAPMKDLHYNRRWRSYAYEDYLDESARGKGPRLSVSESEHTLVRPIEENQGPAEDESLSEENGPNRPSSSLPSMLSPADLEKNISFRTLFSKLSLLFMSKNAHIRMGVAENLGRLAEALLLADPTGDLFSRTWIPLYEEALADADEFVRLLGAAKSLGKLAEALLQADPTGGLLSQKGIPLYEKALANADEFARQGAAQVLGKPAKALLEADPTGGLLSQKGIPLYEQALADADEFVRLGAAKSLGKLAEALLLTDPTGDLLSKTWIPLYEKALADTDELVRQGAAAGFGRLVSSVDLRGLSFPPAQWLLALDQSGSQEVPSRLQIVFQALTPLLTQSENDFTSVWTFSISLLKSLSPQAGTHFLPDLLDLLPKALAIKGPPLDSASIEEAYKDYFQIHSLPRRNTGPKDLIAHVLFDFIFRSLDLPRSFSKRLREKKDSPSYTRLLPLITRLAARDPVILESIRGFEKLRRTMPEKGRGHYDGNVRKILFQAARDWDAFENLGLRDQAVAILSSYKETKGVKSIQSQANRLDEIIPNYVGAIFHFDSDRSRWKDPSPKEINTLIYVSRHKEYQEADHPLNKALRPYFQARLEGKSRGRSMEIYFDNLNKVDGINEDKGPAPAPLKGRVFLSALNLDEKERARQWADAVRHLGELGAVLGEGELKSNLSDLLSQIADDKVPDEARLSSYAASARRWMEEAKGKIPAGRESLYDTVLRHLEEVHRLTVLIQQEGRGEKAAAHHHAQRLEAVIADERDPIEILHLGWPKLGNSCLDCVDGTYQEHAAGYVLHPRIHVLYVRNPRDLSKPVARISVGVDLERKILFPVSPVKTSSPYDIQPLLGAYLKSWADQEGLTILAASSLGYDRRLGEEYSEGKRTIHLKVGPMTIYSDLTGKRDQDWEKEIGGMVYAPSQSVKPASLLHDRIQLNDPALFQTSPTLTSLAVMLWAAGEAGIAFGLLQHGLIGQVLAGAWLLAIWSTHLYLARQIRLKTGRAPPVWVHFARAAVFASYFLPLLNSFAFSFSFGLSFPLWTGPVVHLAFDLFWLVKGGTLRTGTDDGYGYYLTPKVIFWAWFESAALQLGFELLKSNPLAIPILGLIFTALHVISRWDEVKENPLLIFWWYFGGTLFTLLLQSPGGALFSFLVHALFNPLIPLGNAHGWRWTRRLATYSIFTPKTDMSRSEVSREAKRVFREKLGLGILAFSIMGLDMEEVFNNYDPDWGVFIVSERVIDFLQEMTKMESGYAANISGIIFVSKSTYRKARKGDKVELMAIQHERMHNEYMKIHGDERSEGMMIVDELYAYFGSFINVYGKKALKSKNGVVYLQAIISSLLNEYLINSQNRFKTRVRVASAANVIYELLSEENPSFVLDYLRNAKSIDEILSMGAPKAIGRIMDYYAQGYRRTKDELNVEINNYQFFRKKFQAFKDKTFAARYWEKHDLRIKDSMIAELIRASKTNQEVFSIAVNSPGLSEDDKEKISAYRLLATELGFTLEIGFIPEISQYNVLISGKGSPTLSLFDPAFRIVINALKDRNYTKAAKVVEGLRLFWNAVFGPIAETWLLQTALNHFGTTFLPVLLIISTFALLHVALRFKEFRRNKKSLSLVWGLGSAVLTGLLLLPGGFYLSLVPHIIWNALIDIGHKRGWRWTRRLATFSLAPSSDFEGNSSEERKEEWRRFVSEMTNMIRTKEFQRVSSEILSQGLKPEALRDMDLNYLDENQILRVMAYHYGFTGKKGYPGFTDHWAVPLVRELFLADAHNKIKNFNPDDWELENYTADTKLQPGDALVTKGAGNSTFVDLYLGESFRETATYVHLSPTSGAYFDSSLYGNTDETKVLRHGKAVGPKADKLDAMNREIRVSLEKSPSFKPPPGPLPNLPNRVADSIKTRLSRGWISPLEALFQLVNFYVNVGKSSMIQKLASEPHEEAKTIQADAESKLSSFLTSIGREFRKPTAYYMNNLLYKNLLSLGSLGKFDPISHSVVFPLDIRGNEFESTVIHEELHANSRGLPTRILDEGMTEYLTMRVLHQNNGFSFDDLVQKFLEQNDLDKGWADLKSAYTPEILTAALLVLAMGGAEEPLYKAYFEGDDSEIIEKLGEGKWNKILDLTFEFNGTIDEKFDVYIVSLDRILANGSEKSERDYAKAGDFDAGSKGETGGFTGPASVLYDYILLNHPGWLKGMAWRSPAAILGGAFLEGGSAIALMRYAPFGVFLAGALLTTVWGFHVFLAFKLAKQGRAPPVWVHFARAAVFASYFLPLLNSFAFSFSFGLSFPLWTGPVVHLAFDLFWLVKGGTLRTGTDGIPVFRIAFFLLLTGAIFSVVAILFGPTIAPLETKGNNQESHQTAAPEPLTAPSRLFVESDKIKTANLIQSLKEHSDVDTRIEKMMFQLGYVHEDSLVSMIKKLRPDIQLIFFVSHKDLADSMWEKLVNAQIPRLNHRVKFIKNAEPLGHDFPIRFFTPWGRDPGIQVFIPYFDGGSAVADEKYVYMNEQNFSNMLKNDQGKTARSREKAVRLIEKTYGKKAVIFPGPDRFIDRILVPVGETAFGKQTLLVADPLATLDMLAGLSDKERKEALENISAQFKSMNPTLKLDLILARFLEGFPELRQNFSRSSYLNQLNQAIETLKTRHPELTIIRVPSFPSKMRAQKVRQEVPLDLVYTNIIQDSYWDGFRKKRVVYVPSYGIKKLDEEVLRIYESLGRYDEIHPIPGILDSHGLARWRSQIFVVGISVERASPYLHLFTFIGIGGGGVLAWLAFLIYGAKRSWDRLAKESGPEENLELDSPMVPEEIVEKMKALQGKNVRLFTDQTNPRTGKRELNETPMEGILLSESSDSGEFLVFKIGGGPMYAIRNGRSEMERKSESTNIISLELSSGGESKVPESEEPDEIRRLTPLYASDGFWRFPATLPGFPQWTQGWKFHVILTPKDAGQILQLLLPIIKKLHLRHKVIDGIDNLNALIDRRDEQSGKGLVVYLTEADARRIGEDMGFEKIAAESGRTLYEVAGNNLGTVLEDTLKKAGVAPAVDLEWDIKGEGGDKRFGDIHSTGRVGYRYGRLDEGELIFLENGDFTMDNRRRYKPDRLKETLQGPSSEADSLEPEEMVSDEDQADRDLRKGLLWGETGNPLLDDVALPFLEEVGFTLMPLLLFGTVNAMVGFRIVFVLLHLAVGDNGPPRSVAELKNRVLSRLASPKRLLETLFIPTLVSVFALAGAPLHGPSVQSLSGLSGTALPLLLSATAGHQVANGVLQPLLNHVFAGILYFRKASLDAHLRWQKGKFRRIHTKNDRDRILTLLKQLRRLEGFRERVSSDETLGLHMIDGEIVVGLKRIRTEKVEALSNDEDETIARFVLDEGQVHVARTHADLLRNEIAGRITHKNGFIKKGNAPLLVPFSETIDKKEIKPSFATKEPVGLIPVYLAPVLNDDHPAAFRLEPFGNAREKWRKGMIYLFRTPLGYMFVDGSYPRLPEQNEISPRSLREWVFETARGNFDADGLAVTDAGRLLVLKARKRATALFHERLQRKLKSRQKKLFHFEGLTGSVAEKEDRPGIYPPAVSFERAKNWLVDVKRHQGADYRVLKLPFRDSPSDVDYAYVFVEEATEKDKKAVLGLVWDASKEVFNESGIFIHPLPRKKRRPIKPEKLIQQRLFPQETFSKGLLWGETGNPLLDDVALPFLEEVGFTLMPLLLFGTVNAMVGFRIVFVLLHLAVGDNGPPRSVAELKNRVLSRLASPKRLLETLFIPTLVSVFALAGAPLHGPSVQSLSGLSGTALPLLLSATAGHQVANGVLQPLLNHVFAGILYFRKASLGPASNNTIERGGESPPLDLSRGKKVLLFLRRPTPPLAAVELDEENSEAVLTLYGGENTATVRRFSVRDGMKLTFGRHPDNDLRARDDHPNFAEISRFHSKLILDKKGRLTIKDLGSENGSAWRLLSPTPLHAFDAGQSERLFEDNMNRLAEISNRAKEDLYFFYHTKPPTAKTGNEQMVSLTYPAALRAIRAGRIRAVQHGDEILFMTRDAVDGRDGRRSSPSLTKPATIRRAVAFLSLLGIKANRFNVRLFTLLWEAPQFFLGPLFVKAHGDSTRRDALLRGLAVGLILTATTVSAAAVVSFWPASTIDGTAAQIGLSLFVPNILLHGLWLQASSDRLTTSQLRLLQMVRSRHAGRIAQEEFRNELDALFPGIQNQNLSPLTKSLVSTLARRTVQGRNSAVNDLPLLHYLAEHPETDVARYADLRRAASSDPLPGTDVHLTFLDDVRSGERLENRIRTLLAERKGADAVEFFQVTDDAEAVSDDDLAALEKRLGNSVVLIRKGTPLTTATFKKSARIPVASIKRVFLYIPRTRAVSPSFLFQLRRIEEDGVPLFTYVLVEGVLMDIAVVPVPFESLSSYGRFQTLLKSQA